MPKSDEGSYQQYDVICQSNTIHLFDAFGRLKLRNARMSERLALHQDISKEAGWTRRGKLKKWQVGDFSCLGNLFC